MSDNNVELSEIQTEEPRAIDHLSDVELNTSSAPEAEVENPKGKRKVVTRPPCQIATAQAPVQACLRPGLWCLGGRNLHSARETWSIKAGGGVEEVIDKLVAGIAKIETDEHLEVHKVDKKQGYVEIFSFTPGCNWLDVVEVRFHKGEDLDTIYGEAISFSSGLFPAWIPLAFLCSICCCYAPFSGNGMNTKRLLEVRNSMDVDLTVTAETKCNCCPS